MNNGIVFAMANPTPEIMPDEAKAGGAAVVGTGRSDFPQPDQQRAGIPGIFKGALSVRAKGDHRDHEAAGGLRHRRHDSGQRAER